MKDELIFRLAEESDKNEVLSLLNSVFNEQQRSNIQRDEAFWNWKYRSSPFGNSLLTVVESENKIVGVDNLWPWEFSCRGEKLRAFQPCDSAVHPDFRGMGLFTKTRIKSVEIAKEQGFDFLFNFPNQNSLPANLNLGWHFLGRLKWHVKILRPFNIVKGKLKKSKSEVLPIPDNYSIDVNMLDRISERSQSFDSSVRINRKEGFHHWRYLVHPTRKYGMVTVGKSSRPATAAIFTMNQKGVNREMVVVDLLGKKEYVTDLFKEVVRVAKSLDTDFIAVVENSFFSTHDLWKLGFFNKKLKNMVVLPLDIRLENQITSFRNWNMVGAIHDSI